MSQIQVSELLKLSEVDRLKLAQALWESVASSGATYPVSETERHELDRRLEAYAKDPEAGSSWEVVRKRITAR